MYKLGSSTIENPLILNERLERDVDLLSSVDHLLQPLGLNLHLLVSHSLG